MPAPLSGFNPISLPEIDKIWAEEARRRAQACDEGRMKTVSFEEVFGGNSDPHQHCRPNYRVE